MDNGDEVKVNNIVKQKTQEVIARLGAVSVKVSMLALHAGDQGSGPGNTINSKS